MGMLLPQRRCEVMVAKALWRIDGVRLVDGDIRTGRCEAVINETDTNGKLSQLWPGKTVGK